MEGFVVSLSENTLKVSVLDKNSVQGANRVLGENIASGSIINNTDLFAEQLKQVVTELATKKLKTKQISFLVEPDDVILKFVTLSKDSSGDLNEKIIADIKDKLVGVSLDELYFSYQKIAPFVYQFVAIKKTILESYLESSTKAGLELKCVVPWVALLPKFLVDNDPSIFLSKVGKKQVVALSELNGIYFSAVFDKQRSLSEIQEIVKELSVYKRATAIKRVFTLDNADFELGDDYSVTSLPVPVGDLTQDDSFKLHMLFSYVTDSLGYILDTPINLLNLLPLPAPVNTRGRSLVYAGAAMALLVFAGAGMFFLNSPKQTSSTVVKNASNVLSKTSINQVKESTPSKVVEKPDTNATQATEELAKSDLSIRVENAAGVAGVAGKLQQTLEELGYVVSGIGNFEGNNRDNTLIKFKPSKLSYRELLINDIKDDYEVVFDDSLSESAEHDVLIIIGLN